MKSLLAVLFVLAPMTSFAIDNPDAKVSTLKDNDIVRVEKALSSCLAKDYSTMGMRECTDQAIKRADAILNKDYNARVSSLKTAKDDESKDILARLVKSERAWVAFRDAQSNLEGITDLGGTAETVDILSSMLAMTEARIVQLRNL